MRTLPTTMIQVLAPFAPLFSKSVWQHARVLVAGAILAAGRRTVASALRAVGLEDERRFCRYHRVLIREPEKHFETQALLCTDLEADPERIISWFVRRWRMEATFQEVRQRLGFETQRHWSEMAISRTAPAMLGLFSVVVLLAHRMMADRPTEIVRRAAW